MLSALCRAFVNLWMPALRRIMGLSLALTVLSFVVLWLGLALLVRHISLFGSLWLDRLVELLGAVAVLGLSWLLFPAVATLVMGFFLDRIAASVEAADYPANGAARRVSIYETVMTALRLMGLTILLNLLALPVYVLVPGVNFFVFFGLNGYLLGRAYFEVVALRRLDPIVVRGVRRHFAGRLFLGGIMIAGLFAVPCVNLVAPVIATAFMVHLFQDLRRIEPQLPVS